MLQLKSYISGALTGIENAEAIKSFYESIGLLCQELGFNSYVPHLHTDPIKNHDVTPQQVFITDKHEVTNSDLLIAYLGVASFGVGMELAFAEMKGIPVIILYEQGKLISRFPRGIPTKIAEIQFTDYDDALNQLRQVLQSWQKAQSINNNS